MTGLIFHLIPHTHWDREWYLPAAAFQARLVAVVDELLERLHVDPGYRSFLLDGQTVLLEDYLRARPERESDVRALVKTGRLQVGPWYVLADEQIPSGEALVRNLLLGAADAERWGGRLDVLYSPDAFGHPAAWPTLAREFGIRDGGKHIPVFIGADHHAAYPDMSRLRDLLAELEPQSAFRVSRLDEFFQAAAEGAKPAELQGELRWSYRYACTP